MREDVGLELRREFEEATARAEAAPPVAEEVDTEALAIVDNFEVTKAKIAALKARYSGLTIAGLEDRKGYEAVHAARMELRGYRTGTEKIRKALKEESLARGRKIDSIAKEITALLLEIESPLDAEESRIDAERERIKAEKQKETEAKIQRRIDILQKYGQPFTLAEVTQMTDTAFGFLEATAKEGFEAREAQRIAAEAALAKQKAEQEAREAAERKAKEEAEAAERARLEKVRQEQAEEAKRIEAEREAIRKEREAMEAEKRKAEQAAREKQIAEEAAAKAKADAERIAREEAERKAREKAEAEARQKAAEAARPDAEKILALAKVIQEIALPKLSTDAGRAAMTEIDSQIGKFVAYLEAKAKALAPIFNPSAP